jgi:predicted alpha/beta-hydrolase family hydrolase
VKTRDVVTSAGVARVHVLGSRSPTLVVLGHGAGGGVEAPDLQAVAQALAASGRRVALVEQPWRVAGRRLAPRPIVLDTAWVEVVRQLRTRQPGMRTLVVGGRSAGARVACRTSAPLGASGVLALAFPLHPPGRPERSRVDELTTGLATMVIQGSRDVFGSAEEVRAASTGIEVVELPGADHALRARSGALDDPLMGAAAAAVRFLDELGE